MYYRVLLLFVVCVSMSLFLGNCLYSTVIILFIILYAFQFICVYITSTVCVHGGCHDVVIIFHNNNY